MKMRLFILLSLQLTVGAQVKTADVPVAATVIPHPLTMLLRSPVIHSELGLSQDQIVPIEKAVEEVELPLWQSRVLAPADLDAAAKPLLDKLNQKLEMVLSPKQIKRLDQLELQALGLAGLLDESTVSRLRLTRNQRDVLRGKLAAWQRGDKDSWNVQSILNDRQKYMLRSMMGTPFDLSRIRQRACLAPELRGVEAWINSDDPLTLAKMRGKVVVVHYYAFGCINCVRNLPHYNDWYKDFSNERVQIIGIHRPETQAERVIEDVRRKAAEAGAQYPIAIDNQSENWEAWANRVWPTVYLIDKEGFVRYWWYGELDWKGAGGQRWMHGKIEELLKES